MPRPSTHVRIALRLAAGALVLALAGSAAAAAAREPVDSLHAALLDNMERGAELGFAGRRERLAPVVAARFDMPFVARVVMGGAWSDLDDAQRQRFVRALGDLTVATYADRFDSRDGEVFEVYDERALNKGRQLVRARIAAPGDDPVTLDYVVQPGDDGDYRIVNVVANGVSDLSLKRAEYAAVIRAEGFEALLEKLDGQIRALGGGG